MANRQKIRPWMLRKEILVLYYGIQDERTGIWSKLTAVAAIIYLVSPIDLIPDFIPFFGWLDDLVMVPLLLNFAIRLMPSNVREESLIRASRRMKKFQFQIAIIIVVVIVIVFILLRLLFNGK
jgi:uncharacterized membrane protein YkvA (DUF1232 family)